MLWDVALDPRQEEQAFYDQAFGPAADDIKRFYHRWETGQTLTPRTVALAYQDLAQAAAVVKDQPALLGRVNQLRLYARFLHLYIQPKQARTAQQDVDNWVGKWGQEEATRRVKELGELTRDIMDTHMVHSWPFNGNLRQRGKLLGLDVSQWRKPGVIPDADTIEAKFQADMAAMDMSQAKDLSLARFSHDLVPLDPAADAPAATGYKIDRVRTLRQVHRLARGQSLTITFASPAKVQGFIINNDDYLRGLGDLVRQKLDLPDEPVATLEIPPVTRDVFVDLQMNQSPIAMSQPGVIVGGRLKMMTATLYFWVPQGTQRFLLFTSARGGPSFKLMAGDQVIEEHQKADTTQFVVEVPPAMDGRVWSFTGPGNPLILGQLRLAGILNYTALHPALLLVPRETLPAR